ncbi:MAG: hypothetical protein HY549_03310 [Elusimicrobia bacterium]|nr:hypothetical protein [Elusimicrobiota bacterium]
MEKTAMGKVLALGWLVLATYIVIVLAVALILSAAARLRRLFPRHRRPCHEGRLALGHEVPFVKRTFTGW